MTAAVTVATPQLTYEAHVDLLDDDVDGPNDWTVTFGFGKPAAGMYTAVHFAEVPHLSLPERVLEEVVRRVAVDLYGTAWAFTYRPEQYADAIARWGLRRRERVVVTSIEVWE
ncbi:hypothetical protein QOZ88_05775 [Blastococcus sp. BMG 814]|uniref:Uncharacterized protein n=1 Tax=Blastococcus carthaginiensis TaxID=3050034 RepID=A0ABT9I990_9ACTN|nr:hypothetical protein [Blastococcus carthaginiensis]MDP5182138.1 hypothetical protein [Blastococcus carthaginiensis]